MGKKAQMKEWRTAFRTLVFARDSYRCVTCGEPAKDAHHITDRNEIPNGGYCIENGISLCNPCHEMAEQFHATGMPAPGFSPDELYAKIGSSKEEAFERAQRLSDL